MRKFIIGPVLKIFWEHTKRYKITAFLALFFTIIIFVVDVIIPLYYKRIFDTIAATSVPSYEITNALIFILLSILGLQFFAWAARRINQFSIIYFESKIMNDLSQTAFAYLLGHSYNFFVNNFTGSLVRRVNRLSRAFEQFADRLLFEIIPLIVSLTGIITVLFFRHYLLGAIFLVWVMAFIILQFFIARWKLKYNIMTSKKDSEASGVLSDSIMNDVTIKLFNGRDHEFSLFKKVSDDLQKIRFFSWRIDEIINAIQGIIMIGVEFLLIYAGIRLWQKGIITIGDFALIQAYLINAISKLWNFGNILRKMYEAFADATEMVDILNTPHEIKDKINAPALKIKKGVIEFRNVQFSFRQTRKVLKDFDIKISSGEKVALVGPSGAGKTTIIKLLFRLHDITDGGIYIDGQNIADVKQESLKEFIALVPQDPVLFHRTLMDNIRYGKLDATDNEVIEAAKKAHCYEFINQYPEGFNTYVGERGVRLSGGERQRVAIARAILKNAPILVLDEATSSLDSKSELFIQDALVKLMKGKTVIVIAHRLSTIMKMDRIIVMENGNVITTGTHKELLSHKGGLYKKLWEIQAGGFIH